MTHRYRLIYDGKCPVCAAGAACAEIDANSGDLQCVDARKDQQALQRLEDAGLDIDQGMVLMVDDEFIQGAEAAQVLARAAPRHGLFNRMNRALFGTTRRARFIYPVCLAGRNALLKLIGHQPIRSTHTRDSLRE